MVQVSLRTELQEVRRVREDMNQLMDTVRVLSIACKLLTLESG